MHLALVLPLTTSCTSSLPHPASFPTPSTSQLPGQRAKSLQPSRVLVRAKHCTDLHTPPLFALPRERHTQVRGSQVTEGRCSAALVQTGAWSWACGEHRRGQAAAGAQLLACKGRRGLPKAPAAPSPPSKPASKQQQPSSPPLELQAGTKRPG